MFGDELSGGVEFVEGWGFVEIGVGEGGADVEEFGVDGVEVAEESVVVETAFRRGADNGGGGFEVMPVEGFVGAEEREGVGGTELVVDLDRKHGGV